MQLCLCVHAGVEASAILLVLQAGLGQVNGKHTGDTNQASDTPVYQLGRQTGVRNESRRDTEEKAVLIGVMRVRVR